MPAAADQPLVWPVGHRASSVDSCAHSVRVYQGIIRGVRVRAEDGGVG